MSETLANLRAELQRRRRDLGLLMHTETRYNEALNRAIRECPVAMWQPDRELFLTTEGERYYPLSDRATFLAPGHVRQVFMSEEAVDTDDGDLVTNGSFETAGDGQTFDGWTDSVTGIVARVSGGYDTYYCVSLKDSGDGYPASVSQVITVSEGAYCLLAWGKAVGDQGYIYVSNQTAGGQTLVFKNGPASTGFWERVGLIFNVPPGCVSVAVTLYGLETDTTYFDHVQVYALPQAGYEIARYDVRRRTGQQRTVGEDRHYLVLDEDPPEADRLLTVEYLLPWSELSADADETALDQEWLLSKAMTILLLEADPTTESPELVQADLLRYDAWRQARELELRRQRGRRSGKVRSRSWA